MPIESAQHTIRPDSQRKVKIINHGSLPHVERYRDLEIKIPPGGYVLMEAIAANRFISQWFPLAKKLPNGTVLSQGKPLEIKELSSEERQKLEGVTEEQHKEGLKQQEVKASLTCMKCGFVGNTKSGLKTHMTTKHPDLEPIEE